MEVTAWWLMFFMIFGVFVLLSVAFLTLLERNLLGYPQLRKSPNKVGFYGTIQPILDGVKLLGKTLVFPGKMVGSLFYLMPSAIFAVLFLEWAVMPFPSSVFSFSKSGLFLLCLLGQVVYFMLMSGQFSVSKYGLLGALRASGQSISFELVFFFFILSVFLVGSSFQLLSGPLAKFFFFYPLLGAVLVITELGRAPFDFPESESELVSGYNVEYSGVLFVLLFLSEYGFLVLFSALLSFILWSGSVIVLVGNVLFLLVIRAVYLRVKFDQFMGMYWFKVLPLCMWLGSLFLFATL